MIIYRNYLLCFILYLFIITGCNATTDRKATGKLPASDDSSYVEGETVLSDEDIAKQKFNAENEAWVDENVDKDFLLGKVKRSNNPLFVIVDKKHTERNIYLIHPVYEAYKKMYEAALADGVKLIITSGHRTFMEQVYEWELRWNNPRTEIVFENEIDKARFILQYRAMPGTTRHHWGTDIDLNSFELAYYQTPEGIKVYNWLKENAETYGFYQPYTPFDEKRSTGYNEEKWHWSYKPLARLMLVKYLELVSIDDVFGFKGDVAVKKLPLISEWVCGINPKIKETDNIPVNNSIRLIFAGDVMGHSTQINGAWRDGGDSCYNFIPNFQWVKEYISSADVAVANLEVTLAGEPYTGYPTFSSPVSLADALQDAGFNLLVTANNHIMDRGAKGLQQTIDALENLGFKHTGSFKDSLSRGKNYPLIIQKNGFKLAFLNYTYSTNILKAKPPVIVNYIDTVRMAADLMKAREMEADYIITCIHWGEEYKNTENQTQRQIADFLARNGCNLIVGAHPHVVQPIRKIAVNPTADSVLVAYSLGNLVSNQRWRYSDGGIMLEVNLTKTNGIVNLDSYRYEPFWVRRYPERGVQVYRLIPVIDYQNNPGCYPKMNVMEENELMQFYNDTKNIIN